MALKRRNKVSAEFSMSSLTDIIFLLLIFFMLTSALVAPNALNLKLPGNKSNKQTVVAPMNVSISKSGKFKLDGKPVSSENLETFLRREARKKGGGKNVTITISPKEETPIDYTVVIMDMAMRLDLNTVWAVEE